jgi:hypothetical protein
MRRRIGLATIGGGALGVALGIGFTIRAGNLKQERADLCMGCTWSDELEQRDNALIDDEDRAKTVAAIAFTAGGVAIAAGTYLWLTGRRMERTVAVIPTRHGVVLSTRF